MEHELVITNEKIIKFYEKYPSLEFENVNLLFIEMFEKILNSSNGIIDNSILTGILNNVQYLAQNSEKNLSEIKTVRDFHQLSNEKHTSDINNIQTVLSQIGNTLTDNSANLKRDLSESIYKSFSNNEMSTENIKKINSVMESHLSTHLDKTKIFLHENLPNILDTTNKPLIQSISATEKRLSSSLSDIREKSTINSENTIELKQAVNDHILGSKVSVRKGDMSENKLLPLLNQIFPTDEIIHNGGGKQSHCCDYTIIRNKSKNILVENKDYVANIGPDNIKKFIDDIERNNCHGIFISQHSGISGKENFKIDIHKNNVLIYLHQVNYDGGKIKASVEMIDQLSERLNEIDMDENSISKDDLDTINVEFNNFIDAKENMVKMVNDFQKRIITSIKQLNLTCLEKYLTNKFAHLKSFDFVCEYCNKGWDTRRALAAHKKGCSKKAHDKKETELTIETAL